MAKLYYTFQDLSIPRPVTTKSLFSLTNILLYITHTVTIDLTDTDKYHPSDDPNITNFMVSHYNCAKQHNFCHINLLNEKQCLEAPSDIQLANVQAQVYVSSKAKRIKAFNNEVFRLMLKKKARYVSKALKNTDV